MGNIWLRQGGKRTGLKPGFTLSASPDGGYLSVQDEHQQPVPFVDFERGRDDIPSLPVERYTGKGRGCAELIDLLVAASGREENHLRLCGEHRFTGLRPGTVLGISFRLNRLFAWDEGGSPIRFVDRKRAEEYSGGLPLDTYTGGGRPGIPFLHLLAAMACLGLEYATFCETKIRCRCEVGDMNLYRLTDPNRPPSRIITLGRDKSIYSYLTRPVNR